MTPPTRGHISRDFDAELRELRSHLLAMGARCERAVHLATTAFLDRDLAVLAQRQLGGQPGHCVLEGFPSPITCCDLLHHPFFGHRLPLCVVAPGVLPAAR